MVLLLQSGDALCAKSMVETISGSEYLGGGDLGSGPSFGDISGNVIKEIDVSDNAVVADDRAANKVDSRLDNLKERAEALRSSYEEAKEFRGDEGAEERTRIKNEYEETKDAAGKEDGFDASDFPDLAM